MSGDTASIHAYFDDFVATADHPVVVVTTEAAGRRAGCLVGFATQVSINPRRYLVGLSKANNTFRVAADADALAVHLLDAAQLPLARLFGSESGDGVDKFAHCDWYPGPDGLPILTAAPGWFIGKILDRYDFGDHVGTLLEPTAGQMRDGKRKVLRYSAVAHLSPGHSA
ncbi:flavin reductase family protein [Nocardia sp. CDC159]|uniref:Flavin reductase family protein n=1 Tax=Nocardia pulmonis TaxID=2951408 RepID=A0A9X2E682_9NOCA|nr:MULTISPECIES: flavin reductase family protein [Nocardia]MCM6772288.1 flavin reductase family protein [Nocardia pulmonis]MCM6785054.1 flavin reductase family protein [Nocardia sp. CDC159]